MAEITPQGVIGKTLSEYKTNREQDFKDVFGDDLNVDPETPQGQIIGIEAQALSEADDSVVNVANLLDIFKAQGQQLDDLLSLLGFKRGAASQTIVNVVLTGVPASLIPSGSKCKTTTGDLFIILNDVVLDGTGNAVGVAQSIEFGPIAVPVNTLTSIVDLVPGWETIDNTVVGAPGEDQEPDADYLRRYLRSLSINARSPLDAVRAAVLNVPSVINGNFAENDTGSNIVVDGQTLIPNSIGVAVQGGDNVAVATAIQRSKTLGTATQGNITESVPQLTGLGANGPTIDISFFSVSFVVINITLDITTGPDFPLSGIDDIKDAIVKYFAGGFPETDTGVFETDGIQIGEDVSKSRLFTPVNSVQGHVVNTFVLDGGAGSVEIVPIDFTERATVILANIVITVT